MASIIVDTMRSQGVPFEILPRKETQSNLRNVTLSRHNFNRNSYDWRYALTCNLTFFRECFENEKKLKFGLIILILEKRNFSIHYVNSFWYPIRVIKCVKHYVKINSSKLNFLEIFTRTYHTYGWVRSNVVGKIWTRKQKICRQISRAFRFFSF